MLEKPIDHDNQWKNIYFIGQTLNMYLKKNKKNNMNLTLEGLKKS